MARRHNRITRGAHIKRHTEGTSNEISFSVLDAKINALNDQEGGGDTPKATSSFRKRLGTISLFTLRRRKPRATPEKEQGITLPSGEFVSTATEETTQVSKTPISSTSSSWAPSQEEVVKRKSTRKRKRRGVILVAALAVLAVAVGLFFLVNELLSSQKQILDGLSVIISQIESQDEVLLELDDLVASEVMESEKEPLNQDDMQDRFDVLEPKLKEASETLAAIKANAENVQQDLINPLDKEVASQAIIAINARIAMIETGQTILEETLLGKRAQSLAANGWKSLMEGDTYARSAASVVSDTSIENVNDSQELSNFAVSAFQSAMDDFVELRDIYTAIDFNPYVNYLDLRIRAQEAALGSDAAYLSRDRVQAEEFNNQYNELDAQAASLGAELEENPQNKIATLLYESTQEAISTYASERSQAAQADEILRNYVDD